MKKFFRGILYTLKFLIVFIGASIWGIVLFLYKLCTYPFQMDFWREVSAESDRIIEKKKRRKQKEQEAKKIKHYNITGTITVNKSDDESSILR